MELVTGLLNLILVPLGAFACLWLAVRQSDRNARAHVLRILFFLWLAAFIPMFAELGDWVRLFWMSQIPMLGVFMLSGALLFTIWPDDAEFRKEFASRGLEQRISSRTNPALWFLAIMTSLGVMPLFLIAIFRSPEGRNIGAPIRRVFELARWSLGGALPEWLQPISFVDGARGIGYLPREVTVPTGTMLLAAWLWIAFCTIALIGRAIPSARVCRAFLLLSPIVAGGVLIVLARTALAPSSWFDVLLFWITGQDSGVWTSEPAVLRSFGPVLLAAVLSAIPLAILLHRSARSGSPLTGA